MFRIRAGGRLQGHRAGQHLHQRLLPKSGLAHVLGEVQRGPARLRVRDEGAAERQGRQNEVHRVQ